MLDLSIRQLCKLWAELSSALYGDNGFGGNVAEIYCYTVMPMIPCYESNQSSQSSIYLNFQKECCLNFISACKLFEEYNNCTINILYYNSDKGKSMLCLDDYYNMIQQEELRFIHRIHVKVEMKNN